MTAHPMEPVKPVVALPQPEPIEEISPVVPSSFFISDLEDCGDSTSSQHLVLKKLPAVVGQRKSRKSSSVENLQLVRIHQFLPGEIYLACSDQSTS